MPANDMLDIARLANALALEKGATEVASSAYRSRQVDVQWRDGKLETISEATTRGLTISLYVDGRYSSVNTSDLRKDALSRFVAESIAMTKYLAVDPFRRLADPSLYTGRATVDLDLVDPGYAGLSPEARRATAQALEDAARSARGAPSIISVTTSVGDEQNDLSQVHSNGFEGQRRSTVFRASAEVSVKDPDGRKPTGDWYAFARHASALPTPAEIGRLAAERAVARLGSRKPTSAVLPMVVDNRAAGRLVGMLTAALTARALQQKRSFLDGKQGQSVGSAALDIVDDPLLPKALGSRLWDSEGIAAKRFPIVERGLLRSFYVDDYYGRKLSMPPTTRGMSNHAWKLGTRSKEALRSAVKDGIFVTGFLGGNSNSTTGDFSLGVEGFLIKGGALAEPVSELNIAGNQLQLWKQLAAVGNDPWQFSATRTPTLVFEGVQFAGT